MAGMGMILGGAMEGWSEGRLSQIKAERDQRMQELQEARADKRTQADQEFRSREAEIGAQRQVAENQRQEGVQATENQKQRDAAADSKVDYSTNDKGETIAIRGNQATTVVDKDGKPVKLLPKSSDTPSEVATMEYLIKNGAAKDVQDAWGKVRQAKSDPEKSRAGIYKMWVTSLTASGTMSPDEIEAEALKRTDRAMSMLDDDGQPANASGAAEGPGNVIPPDPAKRVIGKIYKAPNGKMAKWTGQGWELVP